MRRITAFSVAVLLALPAPALALDDASGDTQRNPIVWLLDDLGSLLKSATNSIQSPAVATKEQTPVQKSTDAKPNPDVTSKTSEPIAFKNPLTALFNELASLFDSDASQSTETPVETKTEVSVQDIPATSDNVQRAAETETLSDVPARNPIEWLFSDLAKILTPTLEIDDRPAPKTVVAAVPEPVEVPEPVDQVSQDVASLATSEETQPTPTQRNPISWLLSDLATMFAEKNNVAHVDAETPIAPELVNTETPVVAPEIAEPAAIDVAEKTLTAQTPSVPLEAAPWVQTPRENIFDPADNIFDTTGAPLATLETAAPIEEVSVATVIKPALRQRPPYRPAERNHRTLGANHKSVTPDTVDEGIVANVLEQLFGIDVPAQPAEPIANKISDRIVAEEQLDLGYTSPDAPDQATELTHIGDGPLLDHDLYLGRGKLIGQPFKAEDHKNSACVERELHGSIFCLENLDWPAADARNFEADTAFIVPGEAVIRYENGVSSRVYAVFDASQFADVVKIMQRRFGPPQEREIGWMHILEAPKLPNTTFRWKAVTPDRADTIVLEVRNYDDVRRSFADMDHGMVRLFRTGSRPIFKHISTMDLMLMQRRKAAQASVDTNSSQK